MASTSRAKPLSSISSASSRTRNRTALRSRLPCRKWSSVRPRRPNDVGTAFQRRVFAPDGPASVQRLDDEAIRCRQGLGDGGDLDGQFPGRHQHERLDAPKRRIAVFHQGYGECERLAGPVRAWPIRSRPQGDAEWTALDGRRFRDIHAGNRAPGRVAESHVPKNGASGGQDRRWEQGRRSARCCAARRRDGPSHGGSGSRDGSRLAGLPSGGRERWSAWRIRRTRLRGGGHGGSDGCSRVGGRAPSRGILETCELDSLSKEAKTSDSARISGAGMAGRPGAAGETQARQSSRARRARGGIMTDCRHPWVFELFAATGSMRRNAQR